MRSDDGFRLRLGANEVAVMEFVGGRAPADSVVTVHVPRAGLYRYRLTYFESLGGAQAEFLARGPGQATSRLVGDNVGGIIVFQNVDDPPVDDLRIGNRQEPDFSSPFQGRIDEVAIFRRDLSAVEVQAIYAAGSAGWCLPPRLRIVRRAPQPEVRWPLSSAGYQLQVTDRPGNPASWTAVPSTAWTQDAAQQEWTHRDPAWATPDRKRFYRLRRP